MHRQPALATSRSARQESDWAPEPTVALVRDVDFRPNRELLAITWQHGRNHFPCYTGRERGMEGAQVVYPESFTAMVIADLLVGQREQGMLVRSIGFMLERELADDEVFHFFKEHERLPADADCTALGFSVMLRGGIGLLERAHRALDRILANSDERGVVQTYFDPTGERDGIVDPVVCANVLFLAFQLGRASDVKATLDHVREVLVREAYLEGTRYYHSPDSFLYFAGRGIHHFPEAGQPLLEPLRRAVRKRQGTSSHTIDLAQRVLLSTWLDVDDAGELERLMDLRQGTGHWPSDALFRYGRKQIYFGSPVLASTFAMTAIKQGLVRRLDLLAGERR